MEAGEAEDGWPAWRELVSVARPFTGAAEGAVAEMLSLPHAHLLVSRLVNVIGSIHELMVDGERARAQLEAGRLRELVQVKNSFLRMTIHELRRPLGLSHGYLSMLQDGSYGEMPEAIREPVRRIESASHEMANLVDGLTAIARLEDPASALRLAPHRLGSLVAEAVAAVEVERAAKQIRIEPTVSEPDLELEVDAERLRIAVVNLLTNAIKYSPELSTVTIVARRGMHEATVAVTDQGPGIEPGEASTMFREWYRAPGVDAPGLGLGLYIVRTIVELHGGHVRVDSALGQGSTFVIVLPR